MFRHVLPSFKFSSTRKTHRSFYATLPQRRQRTAVPTDGPDHIFIADLPSAEIKSRKTKDEEDTSMSLHFFKGVVAWNNHSPLPV